MRVGLVFTPPAYRGRGIARASVEALTARILSGGDACVLFADLENPTSNAIYRRIGYRPVAELLTFKLASDARA